MNENNKKTLVLSIVAVLAIILLLIGATYAFFQAQFGAGADANVNVTTNTVDQLSFRMFNNTPEDTDPAGISLNANQDNFNESDRQNVTGTTYGTATFTANNKTANDPSPAEITKTYNMYLNISANDFEYTTAAPDQKAELILTIMYSPTGNDADYTEYTAPIEGLNRTTVEGITGYDVTKAQGLIKIAEDYEIKALSGATTTHKWKITLTFVNLDSNQNANTDKTFNAELLMQKEKKIADKYWNDGFSYSTIYKYPNTPELTYASVSALQVGYTDFASKPYYIKTTETENQACVYYNNKEFCFGRNYWVGDAQDEVDGSSTKAKLKTEMATALGISESSLSCSSDPSYAVCTVVTVFDCYASYSSDVFYCGGGTERCGVFDGDSAACIS